MQILAAKKLVHILATAYKYIEFWHVMAVGCGSYANILLPSLTNRFM